MNSVLGIHAADITITPNTITSEAMWLAELIRGRPCCFVDFISTGI